ncbi:hypothetical protein RCL1_005229 [Eukaryota sp. TZLM3-RCL]
MSNIPCSLNFHPRPFQAAQDTFVSIETPASSTPPSSPALPMCSSPFTCRFIYDGRADPAEAKTHCSKYRHVCRFGPICFNNDPTHLAENIHFKDLPECSHGDRCTKLDDKLHRFSCSHNIAHRDFRFVPYKCGRPGYNCKKPEHLFKFTHWDVDNDSADVLKLIPKEDTRRSSSSAPTPTSSTPSAPSESSSSQPKKSSGYSSKPRDYSAKPDLPQISSSIVDLNLYASFCFDATGSMASYIRQTADNIVDMSRKLNDTMKNKIRTSGYDDQDASCNFAFVAYRDIKDSVPVESIPFSPVSQLASKIASVRASGGGDFPEDICTGLDKATELAWGNGHRLVFIVGDAPNHGRRFCKNHGDDYPNADQNGITWEARFDRIIEWARQEKVTFIICPVNNNTYLQPMEQYLKDCLGSDMVLSLDMSGDWISALQNSITDSYAKYLRRLQQ